MTDTPGDPLLEQEGLFGLLGGRRAQSIMLAEDPGGCRSQEITQKSWGPEDEHRSNHLVEGIG